MDTKPEYRDGLDFYVTMSGELPPDFVVEARERNMQERIADPDDPVSGWGGVSPCPETTHIGGVPIDGQVTFYYPDKVESGDPFKYGDFPFRDADTDGPWFMRPDADKWRRQPIWKWQNPDADPHEDLTLSPSIGRRADGDIVFHCYIRDGEIDWL